VVLPDVPGALIQPASTSAPIIGNVTQGRKLAAAAALFTIAVALVAVTAAIHSYGPLFVAWLPLVAAAGVLARRHPGYVPPPPGRPVRSPTRKTPAEDAEPAASQDRLPEP